MRPIKTPCSKPLMISWRLRWTLLWTVLLVVGLCCPAMGSLSTECTDCHGTFAEVHGDVNHTAAPGTGIVAIFEDTAHDDAGWYGTRPFFGVLVNCSLCHASDLLAVHAGNCSTCHPQPYRSLDPWNGGCQQGGCHVQYHADATIAHLPWENSYDYQGNDCDLCHGNSMQVTPSHCMNCHAAYGAADSTPPVTTTNNVGEYLGSARIVFSITDGGKVGVGTTFYRLGSGETVAGSQVLVTETGSHTLQFWSVDQAGNEEAPQTTTFTVVQDTTPPTTTSNAVANYYQGALITLTATDNSTLGVKATYYSINGGTTQTGTRVQIPPTNGTITYTLLFWSEDWSGNTEPANSVTFTVISGSGTIRLVWGDSDATGSPCSADPQARASWTVRRGGWGGAVVASGSGGCPDWSGVDDVPVSVSSTTSYYVTVDWWDSYGGYEDQTVFPSIYVTTPGQIIRLSY